MGSPRSKGPASDWGFLLCHPTVEGRGQEGTGPGDRQTQTEMRDRDIQTEMRDRETEMRDREMRDRARDETQMETEKGPDFPLYQEPTPVLTA